MGILGSTVIGSGIEAGGSVVSSLIGAHSARKQMEFQERMSNTQLQRQKADAEAAGINPLYMVLGGSQGAGVPQGAQFGPDNPFKGVGDRTVSAAIARAEIEKKRAEVNALDTQAGLNTAQTGKEIGITNLNRKQEALIDANRALNALEQGQTSARTRGFEYDNMQKKAEAALYSNEVWGPVAKAIEKFIPAAGQGMTAVKSIVDLIKRSKNPKTLKWIRKWVPVK